MKGVAIFDERFPLLLRGNRQKYRDQLDCYASPSRPGHSFATQQGVAHMLSNDSTRFRIACIFTTLRYVKTQALSLLGTTRLLSSSES
jgi:hypothetical protein